MSAAKPREFINYTDHERLAVVLNKLSVLGPVAPVKAAIGKEELGPAITTLSMNCSILE